MSTKTYTKQPVQKHYTLFCNNINETLKHDLEIQKQYNTFQNPQEEKTQRIDWEPPSTYGLQNSDRIIPEHYFSENPDCLSIDMFYELSKDIRNLKPLNRVQLNYIKTLPKDKILELLEIYNECFKSIEQLLA